MSKPENNISTKADEARRAYFKKWRDNNRDKIKEYNTRYWEKQAEKLNKKEATSNENEND